MTTILEMYARVFPDFVDESGDYYRGDSVQRLMTVAYNKALEDAQKYLNDPGDPEIFEELKIK